MQQVFDYSMSCANTSVIPPCTNKVIHKYVYKFQDLSSYWIGSYLKFNRTKSILSKTKNYKLESKGGLYLTMESKKCIQWRLALWSWLPGGISCEHILQDVQILCFRFSRQPAKFNLSQRFLFVHIGPKCMDWAVQHDSPNYCILISNSKWQFPVPTPINDMTVAIPRILRLGNDDQEYCWTMYTPSLVRWLCTSNLTASAFSENVFPSTCIAFILQA